MKKNKLTLKELEQRIIELEKRPVALPPAYYIVHPLEYQQISNPNLHYHNGIPCHNNPCVWC